MEGDGNILVANCNHRVQKFLSEFKFTISVGSYGKNHFPFDLPFNLVISPTSKKITYNIGFLESSYSDPKSRSDIP